MRTLEKLKNKRGKYIDAYKNLIEHFRKKYNISIRHRFLVTAGGFYDIEKKNIIIDSGSAGTPLGIFFLLHEITHHKHMLVNKYESFYNPDTRLDDPNLIWKVEWECCAAGVKELKKLGFNINRLKYCDKNWMKKNVLPLWLEAYGLTD